MKSFALIVTAGLALGASARGVMAVPAGPDAPADAQKAADQPKANLTPKMKAGDSFTFKQHIVRTETQIVANVPKPQDPPAKDDAKKDDAKKDEPKKAETQVLKQTWTIDQTATYELRVAGVTDEAISLDLELKGIVASAELPRGKASWNSDQPPDDKDITNPIIVAYKPIIGGVTHITMGVNGNITQVLPDSRINLRPSGTLAPMIQLMCSPDMVKFRWGPILWPHDGREPAAVGTPWKNVEEVPNPAIGRFVYTTTNTVKGVKDDLAQIDFTGEIGLVPMENMKAATGTITEQMLKGTVVFDTKFGMTKSQSWNEKSVLDVNAMGWPVKFEKELNCTTTRE